MLWLDEFTQWVGNATRQHFGDRHVLGRMSDFNILRQLTSEAAARAMPASEMGLRASDDDEKLTSLALYFTTPGQITLEPYACTVGRDLALAFEGARATQDVRRRAMDFAKQQFITYVDIAARAFRIGERHQLRALIVVRIPSADFGRLGGSSETWVPDESDGLRIFATWGRIGELADMNLDWIVGSGRVHCDKRSRDALKNDLPDIDRIASELETFLQLVMAFAAVANNLEREYVPAAPAQARERADRATRRRWRKHSLFSVHRLRAPVDNFGRGRNDNLNGRILDRRVAVVGHFKLQSYGPGGQSRKLIYVAGYHRGPVDADPIRPIVRLHAGNVQPPNGLD